MSTKPENPAVAATPIPAQPPPQATQPPPASAQPPPVATQPPPQATQPPPASAQPPPVATQPPPQANQPPPASAQPAPVATQPPPQATQQPPIATQAPPVVTQPSQKAAPTSSPAQSDPTASEAASPTNKEPSPKDSVPTSPLRQLPKGRPMLSRRARTLSCTDPELYEPETRLRSFSMSYEPWGRHVVLALDTSENAKHAFEWFLENIYKQDDMLVLVHCPEAPRLPTFTFKSGFAPPVVEWKKILDEMNEKTRKLEEDYEATCIHRKLRYKIRGEALKNAGEGIIKIAEVEGAAMIVVGNRGISSVKRALLGSVSDYVVRNSSLPVVIVPKQHMK